SAYEKKTDEPKTKRRGDKCVWTQSCVLYFERSVYVQRRRRRRPPDKRRPNKKGDGEKNSNNMRRRRDECVCFNWTQTAAKTGTDGRTEQISINNQAAVDAAAMLMELLT
ncbi:hypothetical protein JOB18_037349, partial [Solea senegalensis]